MNRLAIQNLTVMRGPRIVVDDISLTLERGRVLALLGPNGAGKSSLMLALAGLLPIVSGKIEANGFSLIGRSPETIRNAGVAAVLEGHRVLPGLSVDDNLLAACCNHSRAPAKAAVDEAYRIFPELAERKDQKAGSMSGGQQQMLALAQALVAKPKFILADEMSLGLAPLIVKRLMAVVALLAAEGTGILLIEQFTHVALQLSDEVRVMSRGRFSYSGSPQMLIENPEILHKAYLA